MTWLEIYNKVAFSIWGESTPPAGVTQQLQGVNGIIANAHRKIQKDYSYGFMESETTFTLIDGTASYVLPTNFKEIITRGLRLKDSSTGDFTLPLSPLMPNDAYESFRDADYETDYPIWYEVFGGQIVLYPTPQLTGVVAYLRYYKYLDRPPAVFGSTEDELTIHGHDAIVNLAAAEMCKIKEEFQKAQAFENQAVIEIELLQQNDKQKRRAEINTCQYVGL